jgi:hypothetical protein
MFLLDSDRVDLAQRAPSEDVCVPLGLVLRCGMASTDPENLSTEYVS